MFNALMLVIESCFRCSTPYEVHRHLVLLTSHCFMILCCVSPLSFTVPASKRSKQYSTAIPPSLVVALREFTADITLCTTPPRRARVLSC